MSSLVRRASFNRILVDLNTQYDFLLPRGALPVANRNEILPRIRTLMNWGRVGRLPIISSLEAHRFGENVNRLPPHCIDGSSGQRKLPFTLMPRRILLQGDNTFDLPVDPFRKYQQLIFTKRDRDFLNNPKADRLVNALQVHHFVVFGVVAEHCIKAATLGLITRRHRVVVVQDACGYWSAPEADLAFRQMEAKGAMLVSTEELVSGAAEEKISRMRLPVPVVEEDDFLTPADSAAQTGGNGRGGEGAFATPGSGNGRGAGHRSGRRKSHRPIPVEPIRHKLRAPPH